VRLSKQIVDLTTLMKGLREENEKLIGDRSKAMLALTDAESEVIAKKKDYIESLKEANRKIDELRAVNDELRKENSRLRQ
jgi:hypothetical protein